MKEPLILVPSQLEAGFVRRKLPNIQLCGVGLVDSGLETARLIAKNHENISEVILIGCAGSYNLELFPVGKAFLGAKLICYGIGIGTKSLEELGWGSQALSLQNTGVTVLSVASASATAYDAEARVIKHPEAALEEMEGYAVVKASLGFGLGCRVIRGVSNQVGVRGNWQIGEALEAAVELYLKSMSGA